MLDDVHSNDDHHQHHHSIEEVSINEYSEHDNDDDDLIEQSPSCFKSTTWIHLKYLLDIKNNKKFYLAAQIITRIGFLAKSLMYITLGCLSIAAAVDKHRQPWGPAGAFAELEEMFSGGVIFLLIIGLWCYGSYGIFFVVFDIDQLGRKTAGAILKRFGRIFSSGFYFVLGIDAAQVLAHTRDGETHSGTEQILTWLYKSIPGQIMVCVIALVFFVVAIVYFVYIIKPDKFKKELSTERMTKNLYYSALAFARIGAIGRSMFFAAFGSCLIEAIVKLHHGEQGDTTLLGFQGVFRAIAKFNSTLLFIIASLIVVYAFWCLWLVFFRRLPGHADAKVARELLGSKLDPNLRFNGILFSIPRRVNDIEFN
ncbi:hypothetical protein SAMD00019534_056660 [Acytostelium subglobosum LB1]|uniref:hypothetical protein n=1 Tax=Acytostelium subglobosum LB1 TaxID=1410327 RepID=UPI0006448F37|nr:hypothetical protein SAMD00019534_056660 [Acytostelium subglobosum LB1]GAM22491.1 hypothetical protein SAMD00019534_056660 [Acytostelium subglobosum LB1]|eukprot:XP_012754611.1 hypothetical protein SAMD00019534_056660 [Acytostelium subglobosum LB1]